MQSQQDRFNRDQPEDCWAYQSIFGRRLATDFAIAAHGFIPVTFDPGYNSVYKEKTTTIFIAIDKIVYIRPNTAAPHRAVIGCVSIQKSFQMISEQDARKVSVVDNVYVGNGQRLYSMISYHVLESTERLMELINAERELMRMIHG